MLLPVLKQRIFLIAAIIIFILAKIPHLGYAFYWDESWVYAPAIKLMYEHGPDLLPTAISPDYSRGHPLLFHALCVVWMKLFGASNFSMHCFALFISVLLVVAVYEIVLKLFSKRAAIIATILLLSNSNFFFQSSFVMTDIMLALSALLGIYYYSIKKYLPASIALAVLFFTKESGLVMGVVVGIDIVAGIVRRNSDLKETVKKCLTLAFPSLLIGLFFVIQKYQLGWYLYPNHTDSVQLSLDKTHVLQMGMKFIFSDEQRYWLYILAGLIMMPVAIKGKNKKALAFLLLTLLLFTCMYIFYPKDVVFFIGVGILFLSAVVIFITEWLVLDRAARRFTELSVYFCFAFTFFSVVNFYESRYLIPVVIICSVILVSILLDKYTPRLAKWSTVLIVAVSVAGALSIYSTQFERVAYDRMRVQQHVVDYFEKNVAYDEPICCFSFLQEVHLNDYKTGFLHGTQQYTNVTENITDSSRYVVLDNIDPFLHSEGIHPDSSFVQVYRYQYKDVWAEVYRRKEMQ